MRSRSPNSDTPAGSGPTAATTLTLATESFQSYADIIGRLVPESTGVAFVDVTGVLTWRSASLPDTERLRAILRKATSTFYDPTAGLLSLPVRNANKLRGAIIVAISAAARARPQDELVGRIEGPLAPVLAVLSREWSESAGSAAQTSVLTERTEELEWLYTLSIDLHAGSSDTVAIQKLLESSVDRMEGSFGAISVPGKRLELTHNCVARPDPESAVAFSLAHPYLTSYIQRRGTPLVVNRPRTDIPQVPHCKLLVIPIIPQNEPPCGFIAFFKSLRATDFGRRQLFLGQHIAREVNALLHNQYDLATGLLTRAALEREAAAVIAQHRADEHHCIIHIDIDSMHAVNETLGFDTGDEVIVRIADLLTTPLIPSHALASRSSGDRFVLFLPECDAVQALQRAHALQAAVSKIVIGPNSQRLELTVSCGIARLPQASTPFARALAAAELACRTAKERGRNHSEVYLDLDDSMMRKRGDIFSAKRLRAAIEKDRLQLFAQKVVVMSDPSRVRSLECLVRLATDDGTLLPPAQFMSAAQRYNLQHLIDEWVIESALRLIAPYASRLLHGDMGFSVNISTQALGDAEFAARVLALIGQLDVNPTLVTFEIAETAAVSHLASTEDFVSRIRRLNCRFAFDAFGCSPNSFAYLSSLRPQLIKIDGSIVRDVTVNTTAASLTRTILRRCDTLGIECVASHVDSQATRTKLLELGVRYGQGELFHQPEPLGALLDALGTDESQRLRRLYLSQ